jgi:hypothetical protein
MRKAMLVTLFLFVCSGWAIPGQKSDRFKISVQGTNENKGQPGQPLTNNSIVKLVKAGLSEETITSIVKTQPGQYSLVADDIIALKKAGVSEKIITAMLNKSASETLTAPVTPPPPPEKHAQPPDPPATAPLPHTPATDHGGPSGEPSPTLSQDPQVPNEAGLYALGPGGRLERIEGRVTSFVRSGSRLASAATLGIHANRINTQIPGSHANVTVGQTPTFYYRPVQDEGGLDLILTDLTVKNGRRQFEVGAQGAWRESRGVSVRHQFDFDAKQLEPHLYKIVPNHQLETGQYAFYLLRGREHASVYEGSGFVYCFQVE